MSKPIQDMIDALRYFADPLRVYGIPDTEAGLVAVAEVERVYLPGVFVSKTFSDKLRYTELASARLGQAIGHLRNAEMIAGIGFRAIG